MGAAAASPPSVSYAVSQRVWYPRAGGLPGAGVCRLMRLDGAPVRGLWGCSVQQGGGWQYSCRSQRGASRVRQLSVGSQCSKGSR